MASPWRVHCEGEWFVGPIPGVGLTAIRFAFPDEGVTADAELLVAEAPRTCAAVVAHLPLTGEVVHGIYSGSEVYITFPRPFRVEPEHASGAVRPGDVGYYFIHGGTEYGWGSDLCELCLFYDRDGSPRMPSGPVAVNVFARLVGDTAPFYAVCRRMRREGAKRLLVEAV